MGMNSHFSVYDELIMDPLFTETVPRNSIFIQQWIHIFIVLSH